MKDIFNIECAPSNRDVEMNYDRPQKKIFEIPVTFTYSVNVHRVAEIVAETKEEAIEALKKQLEGNYDPGDFKYIDEFWDYVDYSIEEKKH